MSFKLLASVESENMIVITVAAGLGTLGVAIGQFMERHMAREVVPRDSIVRLLQSACQQEGMAAVATGLSADALGMAAG